MRTDRPCARSGSPRCGRRLVALGDERRTPPFIKRGAVAALSGHYSSQSEAVDAIARRLRDFYRTRYLALYMSRRQDIERAIAAVTRLYRRNVFPAMNVQWGSYPNNIGHMDFPGCFRCHDDQHKARDGSTIRQDCDLCHTIE